MSQTAIPCLILRGGTSRGPYFDRAHLPANRADLTEVLIAVVGAGHPLNIDGMGGGAPVTTKVAILSASDDPWADIDYFFAQVMVDERRVDYAPTCGNILVGVGPAAAELGLVAPGDDETRVRIRAVNTGARVTAVVRTPGGLVEYEGETRVDGVPGTAAPIGLEFEDVVGSATGALFPTGSPRDVIDGVEVTCIDAAMPMVVARARDFGLTGYESPEDLNANRRFFDRFEAIRREAGRRMGMGEVAASVIPKLAVLSPPRAGGTLSARYFVPWTCHPSMAVTGSICLGCCALVPETVAGGLARPTSDSPAIIHVEHPVGQIRVTIDYSFDGSGLTLGSAGVTSTARLLMRGEVLVPASVWDGA